MSHADTLVDDWIIETFREKFDNNNWGQDGNAQHLVRNGCYVIETDVSWECGCYSSWTRDDSKLMEARLGCRCCDRTYNWNYGYWYNMPEIIEEILSRRLPPLASYCNIERRGLEGGEE